jgi:hypothetical protein
MADATPVRINIVITGKDVKLYRTLRSRLAMDGVSLTKWFRQSLVNTVKGNEK